MGKTEFTVDEITKAFIAGTQFGSKMMKDAANFYNLNGQELDQQEVTDQTMVALQTLLEDLGYEAPAPKEEAQ